MHHTTPYRQRWLPLCLLAPQLLITLVFFIWPALLALVQSVQEEDAFGGNTLFVGLDNFRQLLADPLYGESFLTTLQFSGLVSLLSLSIALLLAFFADRILRGSRFYKTLLIWPYAVAPVVASVLWLFMLNPTIGVVPYLLSLVGIAWNPILNPHDAMWMVVLAASWKQISYNFLFFLAGMQAIPASLIEAAAIDGAGPFKRFRDIVLPLLSPTSFFLLIVNLVYAFFDTFAIVHLMTGGGPGTSTTTLVYKVFADGYIGLNLGHSAAQSVILMLFVGVLTLFQFKFVEKKVAY